VLTKSKGVLVASTLALAAAGGTVAVIKVSSSGTETAASTAATTPISPVRGTVAPALPASAGQGERGPLPAGAISADGAVPGALASVRAMAAARTSIAALPHSPELLNDLAGPAGWAKKDATPAAPRAAAGSPMGGIDVAAYQHPVTSQYPGGAPINWSQVAGAGYRFAAVKATEGDYYVNRWATTDLAEAKSAGLDVTPYHFAVPNVSSGQQQAEYAVEYSGYVPGPQTMPLMLDIEYDPYVATDHTNQCYGLTALQMTSWVSAFVTTTRTLTGQYPIIYTTAGWWDACTGGSTAFSSDPMWVANYGVQSPALPAGWPSWAFWQYTSGGTVPGVDSSGTTDLDQFSPTEIGLIDPGALASRPLTRVVVTLASLGAQVGEKLTWTASGLPPGVQVNQDGVITGMITSTGSSLGAVSYAASVTAKNAVGASATVRFSWRVAASCPGHVALGVCPQSKS
jgi:GH25 family lysozyme M1 (1,4-beta-N-acetylmuramidase)